MSDQEYLWCFVAVRQLHARLKSIIGDGDSAPWVRSDPNIVESDADSRGGKWTLRTSLTMQRALLAGHLQAFFVEGERVQSTPAWAWENESAAFNAFHLGHLMLDPLLPDEWQYWSGSKCYFRTQDFDKWLESDDLHEIGSLPKLPPAFDRSTKPELFIFREPSDKPFVPLTEAITWICCQVAIDNDKLHRANWCGFGLFSDSAALEASLATALARFIERASGELIKVRGRYVTDYVSHETAAHSLTEDISANRLRDYAQFDILYEGLEYGTGLSWNSRNLDQVLKGPTDGYRNVEAKRADLMREFPPRSVRVESRFSDRERTAWMKAQPMMSGDKAYDVYRKHARYDGTKQREFRQEWKLLKQTKRGRPAKARK